MKKRVTLFIPLIAGILLAQCIGTCHVYQSNSKTLKVIAELHREGYVIVPNQNLFNSFNDFTTAFNGGLFFTFTVGFCLSLVAWAISWFWADLNHFQSKFPWPLLVIWLAVAATVNANGFNGPATAYVLFIPPAVFKMTSYFLYRSPIPLNWLKICIAGGALAVCLGVGAFKISTYTYIVIRDHLLLSNTLGQKINAFYYDYTLYAAQAFKSMRQKTIRTIDLSAIKDQRLKTRLTKRLLGQDYLPIAKSDLADCSLQAEGKKLHLIHHGTVKMTFSTDDFFQHTSKILLDFSRECDVNQIFRNYLTGGSLLINTVLAVFIIFFSPLMLINLFCFTSVRALIAGSLLTIFMVSGLILLLPDDPKSLQKKSSRPDIKTIQKALENGNWHIRINALQQLCQYRLDIVAFPSYEKMLKSPYVPERYWLANALTISRSDRASQALIQLLNDDQLNVVCMAVRGIGRRYRKSRAKGKIIERVITLIESSTSWYVQRYAYLALRDLGWKQQKSL